MANRLRILCSFRAFYSPVPPGYCRSAPLPQPTDHGQGIMTQTDRDTHAPHPPRRRPWTSVPAKGASMGPAALRIRLVRRWRAGPETAETLATWPPPSPAHRQISPRPESPAGARAAPDTSLRGDRRAPSPIFLGGDRGLPMGRSPASPAPKRGCELTPTVTSTHKHLLHTIGRHPRHARPVYRQRIRRHINLPRTVIRRGCICSHALAQFRRAGLRGTTPICG